MRLNKDQRKGLAEMFGNLIVAWIASGFIVPLLSGEFYGSLLRTIFITLSIGSMCLFSMLYLLKNES